MHLSLDGDTLRVELRWWQKALALRFTPLEIPLAHVRRASTERVKTHWNELRLPGTFIPGLLKAGAYRFEGRKHFWYATRRQPVLRLDLTDEQFDSLTLSVRDNDQWAKTISERLAPQS